MESLVTQNPLFFAFFFPAVVDGIVTLIGQDAEYWNSQKRKVNEASPAYYFLKRSPWLYLLGSFFWFVGWYVVFERVSEPYNIFIALVFISGHSWGSSSWFRKMMKEHRFFQADDQLSIIKSWMLNVSYFFLIAAIATYCFIEYFR